MLDRLSRKDPELRLGWLVDEDFACGLWYNYSTVHERIPSLMVMLNNWVVGNTKKDRPSQRVETLVPARNGKCDLKFGTFDGEGLESEHRVDDLQQCRSNNAATHGHCFQ